MACAFKKLLACILLVLIAYKTGVAYRLPFLSAWWWLPPDIVAWWIKLLDNLVQYPPTSDCGVSKASLWLHSVTLTLTWDIPFFNKFLLALLGWEQVIGLCSKLVHIDLCLLLGCHGLCFQKATSVYIASFDRIFMQALPIDSPSCLHGGDCPQTM